MIESIYTDNLYKFAIQKRYDKTMPEKLDSEILVVITDILSFFAGWHG